MRRDRGLVGNAGAHAVPKAARRWAIVASLSVTVVHPCLPQALGTGAKISGASRDLTPWCRTGAAWSATAAPTGTEGPGFTIRPSTGARPSAIFYPRKKKDDSKKGQPGAADQPGEQPSGGDWAPAPSSP